MGLESIKGDGMKTGTNGYLVFLQDSLVACINISNVKEIIGMCEFTRIPGLPEHISGVINVRGQVVPIADLRRLFSLNTSLGKLSCIIIVETKNGDLGIITDEILDLKKDFDVTKVKDIDTNYDFIKGVYPEDDHIVYVFDFLE